MTDTTPPDWAFKRAQDLRSKRGFTHLDAFAAYIAEHEQPPVDRKVLCAREAIESADMAKLKWDSTTAAAACLRAIELFEDGFGK